MTDTSDRPCEHRYVNRRNCPTCNPIRHGWYGTYTNHGCRCDECRAAWRDYRRATRGTRG